VCGIGGGELDEHPTTTKPGKDGQCAATLAANKFGVGNKPELKGLLEFISANDLRAEGTRFSLFAGLRAMYAANSDPMVAVRWAMQALDAFYAEEVEFSEAMNEFRTNARIETIIADEGKQLKVATMTSDNRSANRCARFLGVAVLIQKTSAGNIQIHTDKKAGVPTLEDVARILRVLEQEAKRSVVTTNWKELGNDGEVAGAEEWYFFARGNMLLNSSLTTTKPPTKLSLEQIKEAVKVGLNCNFFERNHYRQCTEGICPSTRTNPCPWYKYGLDRCQANRTRK